MSDDRRNKQILKPKAVCPATLPNLRRFANASGEQDAIDEETSTICGDVLKAAHRETEHIAGALRTMRPDLRPRVEAMLGVISYCYAKGVFDSAEIEHRLWEDNVFLATFGNEIPTAQSIRSFRRSHRENILAIIEEALQQCRKRTFSQPHSSANHPAAEPDCESARLKAQQLLDMANIMDQLAAD